MGESGWAVPGEATGSGPGGGGEGTTRAHPLLTAPAAALDALRAAMAAPTLSLSLAEAREALVLADQLERVAGAASLAALRVLHAREQLSTHPGAATTAWMADHLSTSRGRARADLAAARATDPETGALRGLGAALVDGRVRRSHVDVAVRAVEKIPASIVGDHREALDELLTDHAVRFDPRDAQGLSEHLVAALAPDSVEERSREAHGCRGLEMRTSRTTGMTVISGQLDPASAALVVTVLDALSAPGRVSSVPVSWPDAPDPAPDDPAAAADGLAAGGSGASGGGGGAGPVTEPGEALGDAPPGFASAPVGARGTAGEPEPGDAAEPGGAANGQPTPVADHRSPAHRLADALVEAMRLAQVGMGVVNPAVEPTQVTIVCTAEQMAHAGPSETPPPTRPHQSRPSGGRADHWQPVDLRDWSGAAEGRAGRGHGGATDVRDQSDEAATTDDDGRGTAPPATTACDCPPPGAATASGVGALSRRALSLLACDAVMHRVVLDRAGAVQQLESVGRLATRAQRRALAARDGGCAFPGCSSPPSWTHAHHVRWWSRGGETTVDNMCLLCPRHHAVIHQEDWQITMAGGVPWFVPPPWLDLAQTPRRNTVHVAIAETLRAAQALLRPDGGRRDPRQRDDAA